MKQPKLILWPLFCLLLTTLLSGGARAQALLTDTTFPTAIAAGTGANSTAINGPQSFSAPGTNGHWIDVAGGTWLVDGTGHLTTSSSNYSTGWLVRPAAENVSSQRIVVYYAADTSADQYCIVVKANPSTGTGYFIFGLLGGAPQIHSLPANGGTSTTNTGSGGPYDQATVVTVTVAPNATAGNDITVVQTQGGTVVRTTTVTGDTSVPTTAASLGVDAFAPSPLITEIKTYSLVAATPVIAVSPNTATTGSSETITLTGTNTAWTGSTTFSVTGGSGASLGTATVNTGSQTASMTLTPGSSAGTLTLHDSADAATATVTASAPANLAGGFTTLSTPSPTAINVFGTGAASSGSTPYSYTYYRSASSAGWSVTGGPPTGAVLLTDGGGISGSSTGTLSDGSAAALASLTGPPIWYTAKVTDNAGAVVYGVPVPARVAPPALAIATIQDSLGTLQDANGLSIIDNLVPNLKTYAGYRSITYANYAIAGSRTADWQPGSSAYNGAKSTANTLYSASPAAQKWLFVRLYANDAGGGSAGVPVTNAAQHTSQLGAIVSQWLVDFPGAKVFVEGGPCISLPAGGPSWLPKEEMLYSFYASDKSLASPGSVYVSDTNAYDYFLLQTGQLGDTLHPNQTGVDSLAAIEAQQFLRAVSGTNTTTTTFISTYQPRRGR